MSCTISTSYALPCFDNSGGVKRVLIANYTSQATWTLDGDNVVSSVTSSPTFYEIEQEIESATYEEPVTNSRQNGTSFVTQTLTIMLHKNTAANRNLANSLRKANTTIIVEDNLGNYILIGRQTGARMTEGNRNLGTTFEDMNGYTLTFEAKESEYAPLVDSTLIDSTIPVSGNSS